MTEILELARKAGFIKQDMSLAHEVIEKNVYLVPSDSHLREFASLLREKFIAELVPTAWMLKTGHGVILEEVKPDCEIDYWKQLYALPKDKD